MLSKTLPLFLIIANQTCSKPEKIASKNTTFKKIYYQEEEIPLLSFSDFHEDETKYEPHLSLYSQEAQNIAYECELISFDDMYIEKKQGETAHEKIMRDSRNGQITACKSAMKHTDDQKTLIHFRDMIKKIHNSPDKKTVRGLNNFYLCNRGKIFCKKF